MSYGELEAGLVRENNDLQARLAQCEGERDQWKASCDLVEAVMQRDKLKAERDAALERVRELEARHHFGACAKCLTCAWRICQQDTPEAVEMKCSNGSTFWRCDYCYSKDRLAELEAAVKAWADSMEHLERFRTEDNIIVYQSSEYALLALRAGMA